VRAYQIELLAEKASSIIMVKRKRTTFLPIFALFFSSFILLAPPLLALLLLLLQQPSPLLEGAAAQMPPQDCDKCIVIEYEGEHTAIIAGVESFTNTTTLQEQYNLYIWQFIDSLVSEGFEIKSVMMYEEADGSTGDMYHVVLGKP
jgi:hypothetical protein